MPEHELTCTRCQETKRDTAFPAEYRSADGRFMYCRACIHEVLTRFRPILEYKGETNANSRPNS